jgi:hypothetical protein
VDSRSIARAPSTHKEEKEEKESWNPTLISERKELLQEKLKLQREDQSLVGMES